MDSNATTMDSKATGKEAVNGNNNNKLMVNHDDACDDPMLDFESMDENESLECTMKETNRMLDMFYMNKFDTLMSLCDKYGDISIYHSLSKSFIMAFYALLTLEPNEVKAAKTQLDKTLHICNKKRRSHSIVENLSSFIWKVDYDKYTDLEVHAELIAAECNTLMALLTFFGDQNFISLIKGAFRVRAANNGYKFCYDILSSRQKWNSEHSQLQYECGVLFGVGIFNLYLSIIPPKILRLLSLVGFTGDRNLANTLLRKSTEIKSGIRYRVAAMSLKTFYLYVEQFGGKGLADDDYEWCQELLRELEEKFPDAVFVRLFAAKFRLLKGEPKKAIEDFLMCISIQDSWKQVHNICRWDLIWSYAIQNDWENAGKYAQLLRDECMYSPATNAYQMAVFKMMQIEDQERDDLKNEVYQLMKSVPTLKIRFAGKTIPQEKFLCTRAIQYEEGETDALVSLMEMLYVWCVYPMLATSTLILPFIDRIDKKILKLEKEVSTKKGRFDMICILLLAKGVLLRNLGRNDESVESLEFVVKNESKIEKDTYISPHAALELSITCFKLADYEKCSFWLRKARSNEVKMLNEAMFQLRAHSVSRKLKAFRRSSVISLSS